MLNDEQPKDSPPKIRIKANDTNDLIYKTEADSQTQKTNLWLPGVEGVGEGQRIWN